MNDVIIIGTLPKKYGGGTGGIATHVFQLAEELVAQGTKVTIYSDVKLTTKVNKNFNIVGLKNVRSLMAYFFYEPLDFIKKILKNDLVNLKSSIVTYLIQLNHHPESCVLHIHSLHNPLCEDELLDKYKCIYTDHGFWQNKSTKVDVLRKRINKALKVISVSGFAQGILMEKFPEIGKCKFTTIYNPISVDILDTNTSATREYCFFNGYSESVVRKGFDNFHYLAHQNPKTKFIAITDEEGVDYLIEKPLSNLEIKGKCDYSAIVDLYKNAKLMVLPSKSESFGLVYIEAAYYGVPVIGYTPVIEEFNEYLGVAIGVGFDPNYQDKEQLLKVYNDIEKLDFDSEYISQKIIDKFSWKNKVTDFLKLYNEIS